MSYVYINIHKYLNEIIRIFNHFVQMAMFQLLFDTKFCSLFLGIPHYFFYKFSLISNICINIDEYSNGIIRIFNHFR